MKIKDKIFVVTGGGSGMGRELVLNLLSKGATVVAVDINEAALKETLNLSGDNQQELSIYALNITDRAAIERLRDELVEKFGYVDGIINNAGIIQPFVRINDLSFEAIERIMNINFYGTLNFIKIFLPILLTRPSAHIVNVSSMGGFLPVAGQTIYGASKAAIKLLSEGLTSELSDTNVKVTTVIPDAMRTNITVNSGLKEEAGDEQKRETAKGILSPTIAAEHIAQAIEKDKRRVYIGKDSKAMNFLYRLNPDYAIRMIYKKIQHKM